MNLILNHEGFEKYLIEKRSLYEGVQYLFRFDNNFGASVVKHRGTYGYRNDLWELAVIRWSYDEMWELDYSTPITNDVRGFLSDEEIRKLLEEIKGL